MYSEIKVIGTGTTQVLAIKLTKCLPEYMNAVRAIIKNFNGAFVIQEITTGFWISVHRECIDTFNTDTYSMEKNSLHSAADGLAEFKYFLFDAGLRTGIHMKSLLVSGDSEKVILPCLPPHEKKIMDLLKFHGINFQVECISKYQRLWIESLEGFVNPLPGTIRKKLKH